MATITEIESTDAISDSRGVINTNFSNLNSDIPVKATGAEITTGTDDAKFTTAKAIADATVGKLGAAWASWTPTWTNLTVGNGTTDAKYIQIGKTVHFRLKFTLGSTSSVGTNSYFTLPIECILSDQNDALNSIVLLRDVGSSRTVPGLCFLFSSTNAYVGFYSTVTSALDSQMFLNRNGITATIPFTWTTGDIISVAGTYEAA